MSTTSIGVGGLSEQRDCLADRIDRFKERCNDWLRLASLSDWEAYRQGHVNFALKCEQSRRSLSELVRGNRWIDPSNPAPEALKYDVSARRRRPIADEATEIVIGERCVIYAWNEQPMLVRVIELPHEVKHLVPSLFTMGGKFSERKIESHSCTVGMSITQGFVEFVPFLGEGELDGPEFLVGRAMRRDNFPVNVVEGGSEIVNRVSTNEANLLCNGFILFDEKESFVGICVCLDDVFERSRFAEIFVKFVDVFRGPINLQACTVCGHGKRPD